ncbi:hypothetical protein PHLGIDRAFT_149961 [Phlebiopsis gigantea 11061_1 CR5-6]|uniref:Uncharacterized protein n=1 Tax=Phlebiopsis gigantea (strain 11061_1 CR5-6) TaxID=745531 RepID=A0A0C3RVT0_PHLG1|nr:hypothetical protein PHLGIDRAFT_149961 [Phlebiopsis gigantea 11061_1 CR5-6]
MCETREREGERAGACRGGGGRFECERWGGRYNVTGDRAYWYKGWREAIGRPRAATATQTCAPASPAGGRARPTPGARARSSSAAAAGSTPTGVRTTRHAGTRARGPCAPPAAAPSASPQGAPPTAAQTRPAAGRTGPATRACTGAPGGIWAAHAGTPEEPLPAQSWVCRSGSYCGGGVGAESWRSERSEKDDDERREDELARTWWWSGWRKMSSQTTEQKEDPSCGGSASGPSRTASRGRTWVFRSQWRHQSRSMFGGGHVLWRRRSQAT